ncbi:BAAT / Acyl-CoA thioester hydrolase C terminal [Microlunatus flavus]|uniref:BAAT / Acyl-CoA thioester hydrolase C terminal n=1 Tax=Microlunatus flavus TaxID=1036181 RepID=A0A1H9AAR5_9ACTN|nr:BAAT / Acyl-CoA thioester hydrolase C terminal [Microlunatus flavus]
MWIVGASRGSEAAALVAVRRHDLVHGLVDLSPSATVGCAYVPAGGGGCADSAWSAGGKPLPFTVMFDDPVPTDEPRAIIPVEEVDGPVLTLCGGSDLVWASCASSDAIQQRLRRHGSRFAHLALAYPDAGHGIDLPMPYLPAAPAALGALPTYGSTPGANDVARADAWPKVLDFIRQAR